MVDIQTDQGNGANDDADIKPQFFVFEYILDVAQKQKVVAAEVDAEQEHKHRTYILYVGGEGSYGVIPYAETAGACSAKSNTQAVKKRKTAKEQKYHANNSEQDIKAVKDERCVLDMRSKLTHTWTRAFCAHEIDTAAFVFLGLRDNCKNKYQHTHTAKPVAEASPVKMAARERFNICKNR